MAASKKRVKFKYAVKTDTGYLGDYYIYYGNKETAPTTLMKYSKTLRKHVKHVQVKKLK